jgi:hypothetical protein
VFYGEWAREDFDIPDLEYLICITYEIYSFYRCALVLLGLLLYFCTVMV